MCKPLARASHTALDFIKNHEPVVLVAKRTDAAHRLKGNRADTAFALHGLKHHGSNTGFGRRNLFNRGNITVRHKNEVRQIRIKIAAHTGVSCSGQRGNRAAVEGVLEDDDLRLGKALHVSVLTGEFDRGLIGFKARIAEETAAQTAFFTKFCGHGFLQINTEIVGAVNQMLNLVLQGLHKHRMVVPEGIHSNTGKAVKITLTFRIGKPKTFALNKRHRKRRKDRQQMCCGFQNNSPALKSMKSGCGRIRRRPQRDARRAAFQSPALAKSQPDNLCILRQRKPRTEGFFEPARKNLRTTCPDAARNRVPARV